MLPLRETFNSKIFDHNPTIDSYLRSVPLNIQSCAYDVNSGEFSGDIAKEALKAKIIKENDNVNLRLVSSVRGKLGPELIREKAAELNFKSKTRHR